MPLDVGATSEGLATRLADGTHCLAALAKIRGENGRLLLELRQRSAERATCGDEEACHQTPETQTPTEDEDGR